MPPPARGAGGRSRRALLPVPRDRALEALLQRVARLEPDQAIGEGGAGGPARVASALARVERDLPAEPAQARDEVDEVPDADLVPGGEVHAVRALEPLRGQHQARREVLHVEEVA